MISPNRPRESARADGTVAVTTKIVEITRAREAAQRPDGGDTVAAMDAAGITDELFYVSTVGWGTPRMPPILRLRPRWLELFPGPGGQPLAKPHPSHSYTLYFSIWGRLSGAERCFFPAFREMRRGR